MGWEYRWIFLISADCSLPQAQQAGYLFNPSFSTYNQQSMNLASFSDPAGVAYQQERSAHWNAIARKRNSWRGMGGWYHRRLREIYSFHVSPNQRILEVGCAQGDLLASLKPARGVGID